MKNETSLLLTNLDLRDGSAVKSMHCSRRRPKLSFLHPHRKTNPGDAPTPRHVLKRENLKMYLFQTIRSKIGIFLRQSLSVNTFILQTTQRISNNYPSGSAKNGQCVQNLTRCQGLANMEEISAPIAIIPLFCSFTFQDPTLDKQNT